MEKIKPDAEQTNIFQLRYEHEVPLQTGKYAVCADSLDRNESPCGGGMVSEFNEFEHAVKCADEINSVNPNHKPQIWTNNNGDYKFVCFIGEEANTPSGNTPNHQTTASGSFDTKNTEKPKQPLKWTQYLEF